MHDKCWVNWVMVAHPFYPSTQDTEECTSEFKVSLPYGGDSRTARTTQRKPVLYSPFSQKRSQLSTVKLSIWGQVLIGLVAFRDPRNNLFFCFWTLWKPPVLQTFHKSAQPDFIWLWCGTLSSVLSCPCYTVATCTFTIYLLQILWHICKVLRTIVENTYSGSCN